LTASRKALSGKSFNNVLFEADSSASNAVAQVKIAIAVELIRVAFNAVFIFIDALTQHVSVTRVRKSIITAIATIRAILNYNISAALPLFTDPTKLKINNNTKKNLIL
jgi:hypothetical protein